MRASLLRFAPSLLAVLLAALPAPARAGAAAPTKSQQKCITSFGAAAAQVARARAAENDACLEAFGKGTLDKLGAATLRSCLARDSKGKVAKKAAKLEQVASKSCTAPEDVPGFGIGRAGASGVAHFVETQTTDLVLDLLSQNLFATARTCDADPGACACQSSVADSTANLAGAELAEFEGCAKKALKGGVAGAPELGRCLSDAALAGSVAADTKGKLAKARAKIGKAFDKSCVALQDGTLPGGCAGLSGDPLRACVADLADCRACLALNDAHALAEDCDLVDDNQSNQSCPGAAVVQDTQVIPSAAQPAETPGTPGVVVTNQKLLAQFGGDVDLNHATYTRYRLRNAPTAQPDAILILVPGFEGGAGGFKVLAENLIPRAFVDHGQVVEVWGFDRRSQQLEDIAGLNQAEQTADAQLALDWLFGGELGLPLSPELTRRAVFYNTTDDVPFMANWTPLVHSQDIDAVVETARAAARDQNVFVGGHSAGTGFAARYAATDFDLTGLGPAQPGYAKLRGLVLLEGGGGSTAGGPPESDVLDLIEARFDGGLFGAVRDAAPRCMDGVTACTTATEETDCDALPISRCVVPVTAYSVFGSLLTPQLLSVSEVGAIQGIHDPDRGQVILQTDQNGVAGNTAISAVPELGVLNLLPLATAEGLLGRFVDDDGATAALAPFLAMSVGAPGPEVDGLVTWLDVDEADQFPPCPGPDCVTPDNGPAPTVPPMSGSAAWGVEQEASRIDRLGETFFAGDTNFSDWYYPSSGLSVTSGLPSLDSSALSADLPLGRGRRDIENLTQAAAIDVPVIGFGGSNGLAALPSTYVPFASSIAACAAPSCDGTTPRIFDAALPSEAFPTFGNAAGGFEVYVTEGYSHVDVLLGEDGPDNHVLAPLSDFLARNAPPAP